MDDIKLTPSEWNILNCLWENSPRTVMQIVGEMEKTVGWARSTTITTLHRMEGKRLVRCQKEGRGTAYIPLVEREKAATAETKSFLERVHRGSVKLMMSALVDGSSLTQKDIDELYAILDKAGEESK